VVEGLLNPSTIRYKDAVRGPNHRKLTDSTVAILIFVGVAFAGFVAVALLNCKGAIHSSTATSTGRSPKTRAAFIRRHSRFGC
jgi:hypothetical protein